MCTIVIRIVLRLFLFQTLAVFATIPGQVPEDLDDSIVGSVEISGFEANEIREDLRDALADLVGAPLDGRRARQLEDDLEAATPGYEVDRRRERTTAGQIRLIFEFRPIPWIPFRESRNILAYHSKLGWSAGLELPVVLENDHRLTIGIHPGNNETLLERTYGYSVGYENRRAGTDHLGFGIEFFSLREVWRPASLAAIAANPDIPEAYRHRRTVEPSITFAFSRSLRLVAGASLSTLESLVSSPRSFDANSAFAGIRFRRDWGTPSDATHGLEASYTVRTASHSLDSDVIYTKHTGRFRYRYASGEDEIISEFSAGHVSGQTPVFERFALGNTATLRGWNKYDLAPAGADSFVHHTIEYRHEKAAVFLDAGSLWDDGQDVRIRLSAGLGYREGPFATSLAFPLSPGGAGAMFLVRLGLSPEWRFGF